MKLLNRLWNDRQGSVASKDLFLAAIVLLTGTAIGAVLLSDPGGGDTSGAGSGSETGQPFGFAGISSPNAWTAGSGFTDQTDAAGISVSEPPDDGGDDDGGDDDGGDDGGGDDGGDVGPLTQGFWKNHPDDWPVDSLTLGDQTYSKQELLDLLGTPVGGQGGADASLILAHQLIAAKLNLANGVDGSSIGGAIAEADALLITEGRLPSGVKPGSTVGKAMVDVAAELDAFNNGSP